MSRIEFDLIDWLRTQVAGRKEVPLGIGDDGALLELDPHTAVIVTDMLLDGVHFDLKTVPPFLAGRKALAVNLSDIAAMGAEAVAAFVSVAIPKGAGSKFAHEVHQGIMNLAAQYNVVLAGGDTNTWSGPFVVNVAVVGQVKKGREFRRSAGKSGDLLLVTGALGGSITGRHLTFEPCLKEASWLQAWGHVHATIDVSDGLAADLHHVAKESGVRAVVDESAIPVHPDAAGSTLTERRVSAVSDGEDFELLFSIPADSRESLFGSWPFSRALTVIGELDIGAGCFWRHPDGSQSPMLPQGWVHEF
jgi:thiamine-monophosphate kinase